MEHISVLLNEVIEKMNVKEDGVYVDCTVGGGGHSFEIAKRLKDGKLICIDKDDYALNRAKEKIGEKENIVYIKDDYTNLKDILKEQGIEKVDGILADLGMSSFQIDDVSRGFSFKNDAPLDMRMDTTKGMTAKDVVNHYSPEALKEIIYKYSDEQFAGNIAKRIVKYRETKEIETTLELVQIIKEAIPKKFHKKKHPAKRTFQALRIEVNNEIDNLESSVQDMIDSLKKGGRLLIITFHSLEDRCVKHVINENKTGCTCPKDFPVCVCGKKPNVKAFKTILPSNEEIEINPRSRSAKLRGIQKL